ncbi:hypothetical protein [Sphaerochaeta pleomorpha]|uniref:hypothetical protein n=1 Tax=Sphaerochaeta pleomorpha TaxID=1131707 RepID=UPI00059C0207|nr:hypothetical protein [Sphaerochaeta pleomorpha]
MENPRVSYESNEYSKLLQMVFLYGSNQQDDYEPYIGNVMRRIFEAFSTFEYRRGPSEISCDPIIIKALNNEKYETYFENLMCRLILDSESHTRDGIISMNNLIFFNAISCDDKKRTARDVLCFMHLLNPDHVAAHLEKDKTIIPIIKSWEQNILSDSDASKTNGITHTSGCENQTPLLAAN